MIKYNIAGELTKHSCVVVPIFEDKTLVGVGKELDVKLGGLLSKMLDAQDFEGKKLQMSFSRTNNKEVKSVLLVGLGNLEQFDTRSWKQVVGACTVALQNKKIRDFAVVVPKDGLDKIGAEKWGSETAVAIEIANYAFDEHKSEKDARVESIKEVSFVDSFSDKDKKAIHSGTKDGQIIGECVNYTRHLGNTPPSIMTPTLLGKSALELGKENEKIKVKVMSLPEIKKAGMGCLLGVSQGSVEEPKFIILEYKGGKAEEKPTVLVGKGITFDSGGLGIKPGNYMNDMKFDMLGAATVLGSIKAAAALGIKKNIVGLIPSCENMPSGSSYRPDDILTAYNGKTVEIIHTDAEGRLILADALSYAVNYKPKEVIDFATLTGACLVALGNERSGLFGSDDKLVENLKNSANQIGEQLWHLPIGEEYSEANKSEVADVKNLSGVGGPGFGGASTAAAFLQFFTDYSWAHIDLSSSYYGGKGKPWIRGGANGFGVQTVVEYFR